MSDDQRADTLNLHARWCSGGCPRWLATGAPTCMPDPCRCAETLSKRPEWVAEPRCWWRNKAGKLTSYCPCWGDRRDGKPDGCCSHHLASPRYLTDTEAAYLALMDPDRAAEQMAEVPDTPANWHAPHDREPLWLEEERPWEAERPRHEPYTPRWTHAEMHCRHSADMLPKGVHCPSCCVTYGSEIAAHMHRTSWLQPCRDPATVLDVDTGAALLIRGADGVWRVDWAANLPLWQAAQHQAKKVRHAA